MTSVVLTTAALLAKIGFFFVVFVYFVLFVADLGFCKAPIMNPCESTS